MKNYEYHKVHELDYINLGHYVNVEPVFLPEHLYENAALSKHQIVRRRIRDDLKVVKSILRANYGINHNLKRFESNLVPIFIFFILLHSIRYHIRVDQYLLAEEVSFL